jgi:hypothetical protein
MLGKEIDFTALEAIGHNLTMVAPTQAGRTGYVCENCGAFALIESFVLVIWHHPHRDDATVCEPAHVGREKLYTKIQKLNLRTFELRAGV